MLEEKEKGGPRLRGDQSTQESSSSHQNQSTSWAGWEEEASAEKLSEDTGRQLLKGDNEGRRNTGYLQSCWNSITQPTIQII